MQRGEITLLFVVGNAVVALRATLALHGEAFALTTEFAYSKKTKQNKKLQNPKQPNSNSFNLLIYNNNILEERKNTDVASTLTKTFFSLIFLRLEMSTLLLTLVIINSSLFVF